jgi:thioredoxin reductase (NADPH)
VVTSGTGHDRCPSQHAGPEAPGSHLRGDAKPDCFGQNNFKRAAENFFWKISGRASRAHRIYETLKFSEAYLISAGSRWPVRQTMDCIIIGGGPAGLTAAIYLARFNRKVTVIDGGDSRARLIPTTHNYPGFAAGIGGLSLLAHLREQAASYHVSVVDGQVGALEKAGERFLARWAGRELQAARIIMATGLVDKCPPIPRLGEAIAAGLVRYCPICDGFEASDQRIAVLGHAAEACGKALFLRSYSKSVTLLTLDGSTPADARCTELQQAGVARPASSVTVIDHEGQTITATLTDGQHLVFDTLYPVLGCDVRSGLAKALGAAHNDVGCLVVDQYQRTTVEGLYAIGDVVSDLHQITVGTGHAAVAATHLHHSLTRNLR